MSPLLLEGRGRGSVSRRCAANRGAGRCVAGRVEASLRVRSARAGLARGIVVAGGAAGERRLSLFITGSASPPLTPEAIFADRFSTCIIGGRLPHGAGRFGLGHPALFDQFPTGTVFRLLPLALMPSPRRNDLCGLGISGFFGARPPHQPRACSPAAKGRKLGSRVSGPDARLNPAPVRPSANPLPSRPLRLLLPSPPSSARAAAA